MKHDCVCQKNYFFHMKSAIATQVNIHFSTVPHFKPASCDCWYNKCMKQKQVGFYVITPPLCPTFSSMQLATAFMPKVCAYSTRNMYTIKRLEPDANKLSHTPSTGQTKAETILWNWNVQHVFGVLEIYHFFIDDSGVWTFCQ